MGKVAARKPKPIPAGFLVLAAPCVAGQTGLPEKKKETRNDSLPPVALKPKNLLEKGFPVCFVFASFALKPTNTQPQVFPTQALPRKELSLAAQQRTPLEASPPH